MESNVRSQLQTIIVAEQLGQLIVTIDRLPFKNSINSKLLEELNFILDQAEADVSCRMVIIKGQQGLFCTGMDLEEMSFLDTNLPEKNQVFFNQYLHTLKRFTLSNKIIISVVDGQVTAGGVGLVAASDLVIATRNSQFHLSEALWGLLPSMVIPFLVRRIGFQKSYAMTLTVLPVSADKAYEINLVDELSDSLEKTIQYLAKRLMYLDESTVLEMKRFFKEMWFMSDDMEKLAVYTTSRLMSQDKTKTNIRNYLQYNKFPWDKE